METIAHISGILAAFIMTTLVGYVFWYIARGHALKERRTRAERVRQPEREAGTRVKKDKSDAEKINDVMGYDFIPVRTITRNQEPKTVREDKDRPEPAATQKTVSNKDRTVRRWEDSRNSEFEDATGRLGISSNFEEAADVPEPVIQSYEEDDRWPEYTAEELDAWDKQMMKWTEEDEAFTAEDEDKDEDDGTDTVKTDDPYEEFSDIWYDTLERRDKAREEIRKKSQNIHRIEENADMSKSTMTDEEIDSLIAD